MAWSVTAKASASSSTDATSYATGSHTPTASRVLIAVVQNDKATTPDIPTVSGNGLTWAILNDGTNDATFVKASGTQFRLSMFGALTGGSPSAGAVTADFAGVTQVGCIISVFEIEVEGGVPASLAALVRQVKTGEDASAGTSGSLTLTPSMLATGRGISAFVHNVNEAVNPRANWTEVHDLNHGAPVRGFDSQYRITAAEDTASASWASSANWIGVFVELKESGSNIAGNQASTTATANTGSPQVAKPGTQATETDTPNTGAPAVAMPGALASTTVTASAGAAAVTPAGSTATETDSAAAGTPALVVAGSLATETDTANAGSSGGGTNLAGNHATETDTATGGAPLAAPAGTRATETDTALGGAAAVVIAGSIVVETETASGGAAAVGAPDVNATSVSTVTAGASSLSMVAGGSSTSTLAAAASSTSTVSDG